MGIVTHGNGYGNTVGYPTLNVASDLKDGVYYGTVSMQKEDITEEGYALMSVIKGLAEIHVIGIPDEDYYNWEVDILSATEIAKEVVINAAMHLYSDEIIERLGVKYE